MFFSSYLCKFNAELNSETVVGNKEKSSSDCRWKPEWCKNQNPRPVNEIYNFKDDEADAKEPKVIKFNMPVHVNLLSKMAKLWHIQHILSSDYFKLSKQIIKLINIRGLSLMKYMRIILYIWWLSRRGWGGSNHWVFDICNKWGMDIYNFNRQYFRAKTQKPKKSQEVFWKSSDPQGHEKISQNFAFSKLKMPYFSPFSTPHT